MIDSDLTPAPFCGSLQAAPTARLHVRSQQQPHHRLMVDAHAADAPELMAAPLPPHMSKRPHPLGHGGEAKRPKFRDDDEESGSQYRCGGAGKL